MLVINPGSIPNTTCGSQNASYSCVESSVSPWALGATQKQQERFFIELTLVMKM